MGVFKGKDFCRIVEYAEGTYNIQIDDAEKVFGTRAKKKNPEPENKKNTNTDKIHENTVSNAKRFRPEAARIIENDPFYDLIEKYPDSVVDFCIVKDESLYSGRDRHWSALVRASRWLFVDDDEAVWQFDAGKADARQIGAGELFAPVDRGGKLNYRGAFLNPPCGNDYNDADFDKINGTDGLEIYEWTTNWSEYFDEGNEWWGSLCLTVYDKSIERFAVIMASATD